MRDDEWYLRFGFSQWFKTWTARIIVILVLVIALLIATVVLLPSYERTDLEMTATQITTENLTAIAPLLITATADTSLRATETP